MAFITLTPLQYIQSLAVAYVAGAITTKIIEYHLKKVVTSKAETKHQQCQPD